MNAEAKIENHIIIIRINVKDLPKIVAGGTLGTEVAVADPDKLATAMLRISNGDQGTGTNAWQNLVDGIIGAAYSGEGEDPVANGFGPLPGTPPSDPQERFK